MKITFDSNELQGIDFPGLFDLADPAALEVSGPNIPGRGFVLLIAEKAAVQQIVDIIDGFLVRAGSGAESLEIEILPDRVNIRGWCDDTLAVSEAVKNEQS